MEKQNASILGIATAVPDICVTPERYVDFVTKVLQLNREKVELIRRFVMRSDIKKRFTVVNDFIAPQEQWSFFDANNSRQFPDTQRRNELYKIEAPKLAYKAAESLLSAWGRSHGEVTHIIFVSCTGLVAPGIECLLLKELNLSPNTQRIAINFMGCFGAFRALAVANAIALQDPEHRVLIVCTELCSLHIQPDMQIDTIVSNAIFGDGAVAMLVGAQPRQTERAWWDIVKSSSKIIEHDAAAMRWDVSNHGFVMRLSHKVPQHIRGGIRLFVETLIHGRAFSECDWAIHPGGKSILHAIEQACNLDREKMASSWHVLENFGNMSSVTVPFVLNHLHSRLQAQWTVGIGFGPGLSVEGILLKNVRHA